MLAGRPSMANYKLPLMRSTHKGEFYVIVVITNVIMIAAWIPMNKQKQTPG